MSHIGAQPVNRTLYHGDNLLVLRGINANTIDLIATDPPFNKGKDFHATPNSLASGARFQDRWTWDEIEDEWVDKLKDDFPDVYHVVQGSRKSYGDDMGAFLCFMAVRLLEMKRILKPTGTIYLHCDPTASHYLKELMDAVFGKNNFIDEVIWFKGYRGTPRKRRFQQEHETLFSYSKNKDKHTWNEIRGKYKDESLARYNKIDENGDRYALVKRKRMDGTVYYGKTYPKGKLQGDVIEVPVLAATAKERTGYPTQKPIELYKRIIEASSNKDDVVLDPFCGCATTLIAAEMLERQWVGIDLWDEAHKVVWDRLKEECDLKTPEGEVRGLGMLKPDAIINFQTEPPENTDEEKEAVPHLKAKMTRPEPPGQRMTRKQMFETLVKEHRTEKGIGCIGCNRVFDDELYLQLDHNVPRSQGGINHISNRMLLCGPCNGIKSDRFTLKGLQNENKKRGRML